jgi:protein ImuA
MSRMFMAALRKAIARIEANGVAASGQNEKAALGHADADKALGGGIARGALHEIYASERDAVSASAFAAMLAQRVAVQKSTLLWVRQDFTAMQCGVLSAQGLLDLGIDPNRLLLVSVKGAANALRAASDSLSCKALGAIVLEVWGAPKSLGDVALRKFSLRAANSRVTFFLVRIAAPEILPSTAETRWSVCAKRTPDFVEEWGSPLFEATLLRNRHGQTGAWAMEWNCDACVFNDPPQNSRPLVSKPADRPHQAVAETPWRNAGG